MPKDIEKCKLTIDVLKEAVSVASAMIEVLEDEVLGSLAVESEKDELLSVEDTAKFLKSDD